MATTFGNVIAGTVDLLVRWIVIPVTSVIPPLVRSGILLAVYSGLWLAFGVGLVVNRDAIGDLWQGLASLPLPIQAGAWLLFLPLTAGLWVWGTDWAEPARLVVIAGLAGWNLLVFLPRRGTSPDPAAA